MNRIRKPLALVASLTLGVVLAQSSKPILELESWLVKIQSKDGQNTEVFERAQKAQPGQTIEYRLKAKNSSDQDVEGLVLDLPIPKNTTYLDNSAIAPENSAVMLASFDNKKTFAAPPLKRKVVRDGKTIEVTVPANEYTTLRWKLSSALKSNQMLEFKARVKVR